MKNVIALGVGISTGLGYGDNALSLIHICGETVVYLTGKGLGGRNQELALAAAPALAGRNAAVFSVGSDGTDGPTDAAGGYVDGDTLSALTAKGWNVFDTLQNNDAYHALKAVDGLIMTGATAVSYTHLNETAIQEALSRLIKNKTVLIIAHRMRTVAGADQVVVLSGGIVAEQGSPAELYARKGLYTHMVDLQSASQNWTI